jgi:hypothetical protein
MHMLNRALPLVIAVSVAIAAPTGAQTTIAVPQSGGDLVGHGAGAGATLLIGQSFTVPAVDNVLQSFTYLGVSAQPNPVTFELYAMSGNQLVGSALFTQAVGPTTGFQAFTFSPAGGLPLTGGGLYVALLRLGENSGVSLAQNQTAPYPGGGHLDCSAATRVCVSASTVDLAFSAQFVSVSAVPEPATLGLLGGGLLALAVGARSRRPGPTVSRRPE